MKRKPASGFIFNAVPLICLFFFFTNSANAQVSNLNPSWLGENGSQGVSEVKFADLDGDGDNDLIFSTRMSIKWMENAGNGDYSEPDQLFDPDENLVTFTVGDVDNDGDEDIVWAILTQTRRNEVWMLENEGNGQFLSQRLLLGTDEIRGIEDLEVFKPYENSVPLLHVINVVPTPVVQTFSLTDEGLTADTLYGNGKNISWAGAFVKSDLNSDDYSDLVIYNYRSGAHIGVLLSDGINGHEYVNLDNPEEGTFKHAILVDVDNDQDLDIVGSLNTRYMQEGNPPDFPDYIYMYENQGDGSFSNRIEVAAIPELISTRAPYPLATLAALDVNNDGYEDLVVAKETNDWEPGRLLWLENQADTTFSAPKTFQASTSDFDNLLTEDVDGDGITDLLASGSLSSRIDWFKRGMQTDGFTGQHTLVEPTITSPLDITAFEVLGSRKGIFVASQSSEKGITYFRNDGNLSFDQPIVLDTTLSYKTQLEHSDVNRDGYEDLVALMRKKRSSFEYYYQVKWFENQKNGTFGKPVTILQGRMEEERLYFAIGDKDGDGDEDMSLLFIPEHIEQPYLHVLENSGIGNFSMHKYIFLPDFSPFHYSDVNNSGAEELVFTAIELKMDGRKAKSLGTLYTFSLDSVQNSEVIEEEDAIEIIEFTESERQIENLSFQFGDVNGDGAGEYLTGTVIPPHFSEVYTRKLTAITRNEDDSEPEVVTIDSSNLDFRQLALADVDEDTDLDIIVEMGQFLSPNTLDRVYKSHFTWYQNNGHGQFTKQDTIDSGIIDSGIFLAEDLDDDGNQEIISVRTLTGNVAIYDGSEIRTATSIRDGDNQPEIPNQISLSQNYPNPFNPTTTISYTIPKNTVVELKVYNLLGQEVQTLVKERKQAGSHQVRFDASSLASGVYIYRLKAADTFISHKMILLK